MSAQVKFCYILSSGEKILSTVIEKSYAQAIVLVTAGKQSSNNYALVESTLLLFLLI